MREKDRERESRERERESRERDIQRETVAIEIINVGNPYCRGRLSTADLLTHTSLDLQVFMMQNYLLFYKTSYLNEEANGTKPSPSVSVP